ncbi:hypothetical protein FZCC0188_11590 [Rhodobacterales bacterium FZCC0188]|nr:hypothetical protein [Rhodobacterales bacterium FZCC0188]
MTKRLAICLFGLAGQAKTWKDGGYKSIDQLDILTEVRRSWTNHLDWDGEIDFFIHTWDVKYAKLIEDLYAPKGMISERQVKFNVWPKLLQEFQLRKRLRGKMSFIYNIFFSLPRHKQLYWKQRTFAAMSRWYSTSKSIQLCEEYALTNNVYYDLAISARLDLVLLRNLSLKGLSVNKLHLGNFNSTPNAKFEIEADHSNLTETVDKLSDLMFIARLDKLNILTDIIDNFENYSMSPHRAAYQAFEKVFKREEFNFVFFPWIDVSIVKSHFYNWKSGGS